MKFLFKKKQPPPIEAPKPSPPPVTPPVTEPADETAPVPPTEPANAVDRPPDRTLYRSLLAGLYDGVLIVDPKGYIIGSNPRIESFFGYTEADLWDTPCADLIPKLTPQVQNKIRSSTQTGRFTVVSAQGRRKNGDSFPAEIAISRIHLLHDDDLIFSIRNLERREKARQTHEMATEALRSTAAAVVVCRGDGRIEYANPAFHKLLQIEAGTDVIRAFIGDFCTSAEAATALIRTPSTHGTWMGPIQMTTHKGIALDFMGTAAASSRKRMEDHVILTLTPLPRRIASETST
jgi:PAS domain S-box-containing protein